MISIKQTYEIVCKGGTVEITSKVYQDLLLGKTFRNPDWPVETFIRYDKDKDLWYTDKIPDGASAKDPGVFSEIKYPYTQSNKVNPNTRAAGRYRKKVQAGIYS